MITPLARIGILAVLSGALSCTAQMVATRGNSSYAPTNERRGGEIKYLSAGADEVLRQRREDAYRQMHEYCSGKYVITKEWDENEGTVSNVWVNSSGSAQANAYGSAWNAQASGTSSQSTTGTAWTSNVVYRHFSFDCRSGRDRTLTATTGAALSVPDEKSRPIPNQVVRGSNASSERTALLLYKGGAALWEVGKEADAEAAFSECATTDPSLAFCQFGLYRVKLKSGDVAGARDACRNYLRLADDSREEMITECAGFVAANGTSAPVRSPVKQDELQSSADRCTEMKRAEMRSAGVSDSAIAAACQ